MPRLVIKNGPHRGMSFRLAGDRLSVGRDFDNTIQIPDARSSRHHAEIRCEESGWVLWDLGSSNGTFLNGKPVKSHTLQDGDEIRIGETVLRFVRDEPAGAGPVLERAATAPEFAGFETLLAGKNRLLEAERADRAPEELKRANARLVRLYELARASAGADTVAELLEKASELVERAIEADRVFPILYEEPGRWTPWGRPVRAGARGAIARAVAGAPVSMGVVETVLRERKSILTRAPEDERFRERESVKLNETGSVLCVPLSAHDRFLGVLYADRLAGGEDFSREDLEFLDAAAAYVALALEGLREREGVVRRAEALSRDLRAEYTMIGESPAMRRVFEFLERASPVDSSILILGESGTGKELVARAVHASSRRALGPFEVVNCAALAESLVESELFGHVKGAYTGATADRPGRFELADGGTIFLDEIGELPDRIQTKLLRVLEQGECCRVGDSRVRHVDVRVIAATNRDLDREVAAGRFRRDLYYRLNVLRVELPPLRERGDDLWLLIDHYSAYYARKCGRASLTLSPEVRELFRAYPWPGNVRQLRNVLERLAVLVPAEPITERDLPPGLLAAPAGVSEARAGATLEEVEREHILRVLASVNGNKKRAAEILGIDRSTLYAKLKAYGKDPGE